jgi:uncharacterized coiled-coil protein SlyX
LSGTTFITEVQKGFLQNQVDKRFNDVERRLDTQAHKLDKRLDDVERRLDTQAHKLDKRLDDMERRLDTQAHKLDEISSSLKKLGEVGPLQCILHPACNSDAVHACAAARSSWNVVQPCFLHSASAVQPSSQLG